MFEIVYFPQDPIYKKKKINEGESGGVESYEGESGGVGFVTRVF